MRPESPNTLALKKPSYTRLRILILVIVVLACGGYFIIKTPYTTHAAEFNWVANEPTASTPDYLSTNPNDYNNYGQCTNQKVYIGNALAPDAVCVYQGKSFRYGVYYKYVWGTPQYEFVVSMGADSHMYVVDNVSEMQYFIPSPQTNDVLYVRYGATRIAKDLPSSLTSHIGLDGAVHYQFSANPFHSLNYDDVNEYEDTYMGGISSNGKWAIVQLRNVGIMRVDMQDLSVDLFTQYDFSGSSYGGHQLEMAITNDGRFAAVVGAGVQSQLFDLAADCGDTQSVIQSRWKTSAMSLQKPCPSRDITSTINKALGYSMTYASAPSFNDDGGQLTLLTSVYGGPQKGVTLSVAGYPQTPRLDYLALGDSYSSGEGDIDTQPNGRSYYLPMTDTGFDRCHVSSRSYPFLLRDYLAISPNKMKSVACSSAQVVFDYARPNDGYFGQGDRLIKQPNIEELKTSALNTFIPGRVPQLEFVKKYHPSVVTLTGGGNDVGFASILNYCAMPEWEGLVIDDTCAYAKEGSELRQALGRTIHDQYAYTTRLLKEINNASPNTKIYVVGYPSFIAGSMANCALNSGVLNGRERDMINEGISYLNVILKQASMVSGAHYVDIQNSLNGGRLCEGSEYITGVWDGVIVRHAGTNQTFHPNYKGHYQIAKTIEQSGDFSLDPVFTPVTIDTGPPPIPAYFGVNDTTTTEQHTISKSSVFVNGAKAILQLSLDTLQPGSTVHVTLHSDPVDLGTFTAENDGSFKTEVTIPMSLQPGYHVLTLKSFSPSGEPIEYYQFIEVQSGIPNDVDGDSILDSTDKCNYITHWYNELTGADACSVTPEQKGSGSTDGGSKPTTQALDSQPSVEAVVSHPETLTYLSPDPTTKDVKGVQTSHAAALPISTRMSDIVILAGVTVVVTGGLMGIVYGVIRRHKLEDTYHRIDN